MERPHQATFSLTFNYDVRDELRREGHEVANTIGGSFSVVSLTPELGYRFPRGFSARVRAPIHWKAFDETMVSPEIHREVSGLGDLELLGSYDLFALPRRWRLSLTAGAALPTGGHVVQPFVGDVAPTPLQLGSGTLDPILAVHGAWDPHPRWSFDASGAARLAVMANLHDYRPASLFELGIGGQWRALPRRLGVVLHGYYSHATRVEQSGVEARNTGRDAFYVEPGASVVLWPGLSLQATVRVTAYLRVNETQFAESALFAARLVYRTPPLF